LYNGDSQFGGKGSGNEMILSGKGDDISFGDTPSGGSGSDMILTGQGDDQLTMIN
jgi:Ca2+-binding RTX toxin-like protein